MTTFKINGYNIPIHGHTVTIGRNFDYKRYIEDAPRGRWFNIEHMDKTIIQDIKSAYEEELMPNMPKGMTFKVDRSKTDCQMINISVSGIPACNGPDYEIIKQSIKNFIKEFTFEDNAVDYMTDCFRIYKYYDFNIKFREPTKKVIKNYVSPSLYCGRYNIIKREVLERVKEEEDQKLKAVIDSLPPPPAEWLEPQVEVHTVKEKQNRLESILTECLPESPVKPGMPRNFISDITYNPKIDCFSFTVGF